MVKNKELQVDIEQYEWNEERGGSFMKTICKAISLADVNNLEKLYKAFPDLVNGYIGYTYGKTWGEFIIPIKLSKM